MKPGETKRKFDREKMKKDGFDFWFLQISYKQNYILQTKIQIIQTLYKNTNTYKHNDIDIDNDIYI